MRQDEVAFLLKKRNLYVLKLIVTFISLSLLNHLIQYLPRSDWLFLLELFNLIVGMLLGGYFLYKIILDSFCPRCKSLFFGVVISRNSCRNCGLSVSTSGEYDDEKTRSR